MQRTLAWLLPVLLICLPALAQEKDADRIPLKISKETTYFIGPITEDGIINYVAALNKRYGESVKQDDNAFALVAQLHPKQTPDWAEDHVIYRDRLFEALAIEADDAMPSLVTWRGYAAQAGLEEVQFEGMIDEALQGPWTEKKLPHVHEWMLTNTAVMEKLDEALNRPKYFAPLIQTSGDEALPAIILPQLSLLREASKLIVVHGLHAFAKGDTATTLADTSRLQKFGKLVSHEPTVIGVLVGISLQNMQRKLIEILVEAGELTHKESINYLKTYKHVGAVDTIDQAIQHER